MIITIVFHTTSSAKLCFAFHKPFAHIITSWHFVYQHQRMCVIRTWTLFWESAQTFVIAKNPWPARMWATLRLLIYFNKKFWAGFLGHQGCGLPLRALFRLSVPLCQQGCGPLLETLFNKDTGFNHLGGSEKKSGCPPCCSDFWFYDGVTWVF